MKMAAPVQRFVEKHIGKAWIASVFAFLYLPLIIVVIYSFNNSKLNAVEYHRSSEINVAATDAILILGLLADVAEDFTYDTSKMEAFLVPAGTGVEVFATSLHYAPCGVDGQGFQVAIVLPQGTNYPLEGAHQKVEQGKAPSEDDRPSAIRASSSATGGRTAGSCQKGMTMMSASVSPSSP